MLISIPGVLNGVLKPLKPLLNHRKAPLDWNTFDWENCGVCYCVCFGQLQTVLNQGLDLKGNLNRCQSGSRTGTKHVVNIVVWRETRDKSQRNGECGGKMMNVEGAVWIELKMLCLLYVQHKCTKGFRQMCNLLHWLLHNKQSFKVIFNKYLVSVYLKCFFFR